MNNYGNVRFSGMGYTCMFDRNLVCRFSDNCELSGFLTRSRKVRTVYRLHIGGSGTFEHRFMTGGVRYRSVFQPFFDMFCLCRIYPEDCFMKQSYSELYRYVSDIRMCSAQTLALAKRTEERICSCNDCEKYDDLTGELTAAAEKMFSASGSVLKLFDTERVFEYIPLVRYLSATNEFIRKNNDLLGRHIELEAELTRGVARMNYAIFEAALLSVIRVFYRVMRSGDRIKLRITDSRNGDLLLSAEYTARGLSEDHVPKHDIELLSCSFGCLNGRCRLYFSGEKLVFRASVPASLSGYFNRIKDHSDISDGAEDISDNITYMLSPDLRSARPSFSPDLSALMWDIAMRELYEAAAV